jgi:hypothetical protein
MVLSKISDLGGEICVDSGGLEIRKPAVADGTAKAGWIVSLTTAGVVAGVDVDAGPDAITGILDRRYDTPIDDVPTAGLAVEVIIPVAGRRYRIFVTDLNSSLGGVTVGPGSTAGALSVVAAVEDAHVARTDKYTDGDTVAEVIWGA